MTPTATIQSARQPGTISPQYLPLHLYLSDRRAEIVVLTFQEIETLLGFPLPAPARTMPGWWANIGSSGSPSPQSSSWTQADMSATPSLLTGTVVFERPGAFA